MEPVAASQLVNVVAPSDMEAGFQFQAEYDGQPVRVLPSAVCVCSTLSRSLFCIVPRDGSGGRSQGRTDLGSAIHCCDDDDDECGSDHVVGRGGQRAGRKLAQ